MKLPTLNVDVAVNTSGMKKDVERANKQLQQIGGKGLALAGGSFGKIGSLGGLGGGLGSAAIGIGAGALAAAAPFMVMSRVVDGFSNAMKQGQSAMETFAKTGKTGGMNIAAALPLAMANQKTNEVQKQGFFEGISTAFFAGATDQYGNTGGVMSFMQEIPLLLRGLAAMAGSQLSGGSHAEQQRQFGMHSAASQGAAMSYMTQEELRSLSRMIEQQTRNQREQGT
jgi:hypothetical protein